MRKIERKVLVKLEYEGMFRLQQNFISKCQTLKFSQNVTKISNGHEEKGVGINNLDCTCVNWQ